MKRQGLEERYKVGDEDEGLTCVCICWRLDLDWFLPCFNGWCIVLFSNQYPNMFQEDQQESTHSYDIHIPAYQSRTYTEKYAQRSVLRTSLRFAWLTPKLNQAPLVSFIPILSKYAFLAPSKFPSSNSFVPLSIKSFAWSSVGSVEDGGVDVEDAYPFH
jgi:hypothetical protein